MREQPSTRLGRGLIAVLVVLGVAATVMAYLVTSRILERRQAAPPRTANSTAANSTAASPAPGAGSADGESCPEPTRAAVAAAGLDDALTLRIYVEFTVPKGQARAWICQNADGVLIYQAHERQGPFDRADNAINTLLLADGIRGQVEPVADGYRATNLGPAGSITEYLVTETLVTITYPSGNATSAEVTSVYVPG